MCSDCDTFACLCKCEFPEEDMICRKCFHKAMERDVSDEIWDDYVNEEVHSIRGY